MKKTDAEAFASEYCMSAGDNALRRDQINAAIVSRATTNEHSFREAAMAGLDAIAGQEKTTRSTPPPPLTPVDDDTRMAADIPDSGAVKTATHRTGGKTGRGGTRP